MVSSVRIRVTVRIRVRFSFSGAKVQETQFFIIVSITNFMRTIQRTKMGEVKFG